MIKFLRILIFFYTKMENIHKKLSEIWLKENEISIYLCSLSYWALPASVLWQKTNITRSNAQYICQKLIDKWLLLYVDTPKGNLYSPESPEKIISLLNREYDKIDAKVEQAKAIMPFLNSIMKEDLSESKVTFFKWEKGFIDMAENTLKEKPKKIYALYSGLDNSSNTNIAKYLKNTYQKQRIKNWTAVCKIVNWEKKKYSISEKKINTKLVLPKNILDIRNSIKIYWNNVSIWSINNKNLSWILIKNQDVADTMKSIIEYIRKNEMDK